MQARKALQANCCAHLAARPDPSPTCSRQDRLTFAPCAAEARGSWMLQREAKTEVASCHDQWRTAAAPQAEYAAALQSRWTQLAPLLVAAAAARHWWSGGPMEPSQPFCRAPQQRQQCARVSMRTQGSYSQRTAAAACASCMTCAIAAVCLAAAHGATRGMRNAAQEEPRFLWATKG